MKLSKYRPSKDAPIELSSISMIDVVFLLLIFFLVTTTFFRPERQLKPNIKISQHAGSQEFQDIEPAIVDITQRNGTPMFRLGAIATADVSEIQKRLDEFPDKSRGAFVRVADHVPYGMVAQAVNACKQSGFVLISILPLR